MNWLTQDIFRPDFIQMHRMLKMNVEGFPLEKMDLYHRTP